MHTKFIRLSILLLCLVSVKTFAQNTLTGMVFNAAKNIPISGALLQIPDLKVSAITDSNGNYVFENLPKGTYLVEADALGFASNAQSVRTVGKASLNFPLTVSAYEENEVVVTGASAARNRLTTPQPITEITN